MKLNNRGMTMVEIMASVALISIVLIFLMNLFLNVRTTYNQSKVSADYDILVSNVIRAIGKDIDNYGLKSVRYANNSRHDKVVLTFNTFRETILNENIVKVLYIYSKNDNYYISYGYDADFMINSNITSPERITSVVRNIPNNVIMPPNYNFINLSQEQDCMRINIPLTDKVGNIYDINIYGILE